MNSPNVRHLIRRIPIEARRVSLTERYAEVLVARRLAEHNLSAVCSDLTRIALGADASYEDLEAFSAPSECYGDVNRSICKEVRACLVKHHFHTTDILLAVLKERVSHKWWISSPLAYALGYIN